MHLLQNNVLKVSIAPKGAEIQSLFNLTNKTEYLWQADPTIWGRHAPVLFPIVGQIENNCYRIDGQEYHLSQHGFARDQEFRVMAKTKTSITLELSSNPQTKKVYPYDFKLQIGYQLMHNQLKINYSVQNKSTDALPFSIGAHPGFRVPLFKNQKFEDYYFEFEKEETLDRILFDKGLLSGKIETRYLDKTKIIPLSQKLFEKDALIFKGCISDYIVLKNHKNKGVLKVTIAGFPYLGLWSPPGKNASFVCIEPWYGIADTRGAAKDFKDKEGRIHLNKNDRFDCSYGFEVE